MISELDEEVSYKLTHAFQAIFLKPYYAESALAE